jgi:hypothetical protein
MLGDRRELLLRIRDHGDLLGELSFVDRQARTLSGGTTCRRGLVRVRPLDHPKRDAVRSRDGGAQRARRKDRDGTTIGGTDMTQEERTGTWQSHGHDPLVAEIRADPKVPKVEGDPYLVYELHESTTEPAEQPLAQLGVSSHAAVRFSPEEVGCFFAQSPQQACEAAARFQGKLGHFVAIEGKHVPLDFTSRPE